MTSNRCTPVEAPIQPDQPFIGLDTQIVHVNLAFA